jgi:LuxR family transcriptional regulator, quorum-sensing system regulator BjaR1
VLRFIREASTIAMGTSQLRRRQAAKPKPTARESEVLRWVAHGKSAWEIGEILHITKRTVDEHVQAVVRKLGATNRTNAVAIALRDGLIKL